MPSRNLRPLRASAPPILGALLALPAFLFLALAPARADNYLGYRRIGSWNLAKKTTPAGKRIEMMAVASKENEDDFFLIMCAGETSSLYVSIITKDPTLTVEEPLRLDVSYGFDGRPAHFEMQKVLVDDQAVLRDDDKVHVAALIAAFGTARQMTVTTGTFMRSYELDAFKPAFEIVNTACSKSAPS
jgi:hypothetical protein